jgi:hypothetical protein
VPRHVPQWLRVELVRPSSIAGVEAHCLVDLALYGSNAKIRFQSSFTLMTIQPFGWEGYQV